jgi:hypothetical protein
MRAVSTRNACALLLCWLRPSWHSATMPVGRWVMRTAESVLLMCWPPAPLARKVSMRRSDGLILIGLLFVRLGQNGHRAGTGVDAALGFGGGHALHPVATGFVAKLAVDPFTFTMRITTSL